MAGHAPYDHRLIESALHDLEVRHELLSPSDSGALYAFEVENFQILAVNEAACVLYGYTRDELLGMTTRDLRAPSARVGMWRIEAALRAGHEVNVIVQHVRPDGTIIHVELRTTTPAIGNGRIRIALARDITEQQRGADSAEMLDRASVVLMASLERDTLCRNLALLAVPALGDWCVVHRVNDAGFVTACGFAHANPLEQPIVGELFEARGTLSADHPVARAAATGTAIVERNVLDGSNTMMGSAESDFHRILATRELLCVPVMSGGRALAVIECARTSSGAEYGASANALADALAERAALAMDNAASYSALVERLNRHEASTTKHPAAHDEDWRWVVENLPDCYFRISGDWTITYANGKAISLLGRPREEVVGQNLWTLFATDVGGVFDQHYRRALAEQRPLTFEAFYPGLDIWVEVNVRPAAEGFALFFRDNTTHHHALERLESSEENYRDFLESATDLIHMIAPDGRVLFANRAWRETLGYSEDEVQRLNVLDVVAPEFRQAARETLRQCLDGVDLPEVEMVVLAKDGRRVTIRGRANCRTVDGRPVSTRAIYRDVTAQAEANQRLERAKRTEAASARAKTAFLDRMSHEMRTPLSAVIGFANLLEANRGGRLSEKDVDFAHRIGQQGRNLLAIVEDVLSYAEIESRRVDLVVAPVDLGALVEEVCALYREQALQNHVTLICRAPTRPLLFQTDASVLRRVLRYLLSDAVGKTAAERVLITVDADASGLVPDSVTVETRLREGSAIPVIDAAPSAALELGLSIGQSLAQMLGYELDVERRSELKLVRTLQLRSTPRLDGHAGESAKTLHALLDASPLPIIAFEPDWTVRLWNKAAQNLFGYTSAEAIERRLALLPPLDEQAFRELLLVALDHEHGVTDAPAVHVHQDGRRIDVSLALAALRAPDGRLRGFLSIVTDVTARKRMEAELRQAQKMEVVGRLSGGIAHDFNNLLTVISAHAQFLMADLAGDEARVADARSIQDATERASALTRQLLAFSRKEAPHRRNVDLNQQLLNTERLLRRILGSHMEFVVVPASTPAVVYADAAQIEQVLMNLVLNARDAMPRGGALVVEVSTHAEGDDAVARGDVPIAGDYARITVSDTGIGMDEETKARVFEPFFTTKPEGRGTGLGLSTVHELVRQSGGTIGIESALGRGTIFTIRLPLVERNEAMSTDIDPTPARRGTETVLLVEDQEAVRAVAARVLRGRGYHVLLARHGNDALDIVQERGATIDLLLTDLVMPVMPGTEVASRVRALAPGIRVLFMSGYSETPFGMSAGDADIPMIRKPFSADELARAVRDALDAP